MKIWISSLRDVHDAAKEANPERIISLLSPGSEFPAFETHANETHFKVEIHDIVEDMEDRRAPDRDQVSEIVSFLEHWNPDEAILVHCWAGMSRSTATAYIAACLHNPNTDEGAIATALQMASPTAFPNTRMVAIADQMLGRGGRMTQAAEDIRNDEARVAEIYRIQQATPFFIPSRY
ncbi:MAG: hypothetical protein AAGB02_03400 [Pseudomonadota bacterium]